jgi:hypothetical protein
MTSNVESVAAASVVVASPRSTMLISPEEVSRAARSHGFTASSDLNLSVQEQEEGVVQPPFVDQDFPGGDCHLVGPAVARAVAS